MTARTRVLIVDDSAVMRTLLRSVMTADPRLEVAGTAANGADALEAVATVKPDLMLLDLEMPVMDGMEVLRRLQTQGSRLPVIMCSAVTQRGARVTIEALATGAADYVAKPAQSASRELAMERLRAELLPKIAALTRRKRDIRLAAPLPAAAAMEAAPRIVAIGVSTGGPAALERVLPELPSYFPLPVLVVQHMPEHFTRPLAERLNGACRMRVCEAAEGAAVRAGEVVIARGDWHLEVQCDSSGAAKQHLTREPPENHCRPSVDVLFRSCAAVYGAGTVAVVLTGMGSDGLAGCRALREAGGTVLAQDEASSTVWGMPGAVVQAGQANRILPLNQIAAELVRIASGKRNEAQRFRDAVV